jgi:replicative DNA helicase
MPDGNAQQQGGRVPPSDLDAEGAVLSSCLLHPGECLDDVRQQLPVAAFYADANRRIYETILELDNEGKGIDIVLVAGRLREREKLASIGGSPYLAQLSDATPAVANVLEHAAVIVEKWRLRQAITACQRFAAEGYQDVGEPQTWLQNAAQALADIAATGDASNPPEGLDVIIPAEVHAIRERAQRNIEIVGLDTKLELVNKLTGGLEETLMHVVGGRPGMGKTSFALQLALNVAVQGIGVVFCSAEMNQRQLAHKMIANDARIDHSRVRSGVMQREEWPVFAESAKYLATLPFIVYHQTGMTIPAMRGAVRKSQRQFEARGIRLGLIVADYLQIFDGSGLVGQRDSREREVSEISKRLLWMAGEFNVAMLALSQLNRAVESRANKSKRPTMSDLRESGQIEQDAATIMLLYRDEYYHKDSPDKGTVEAIVAKNRFGTTGKAYLKFTPEYGRIDNLESTYAYGGADDTGDQQ